MQRALSASGFSNSEGRFPAQEAWAKPHHVRASVEDLLGREVLPKTSGQEVQFVLWHWDRKDEDNSSPILTSMVCLISMLVCSRWLLFCPELVGLKEKKKKIKKCQLNYCSYSTYLKREPQSHLSSCSGCKPVPSAALNFHMVFVNYEDIKWCKDCNSSYRQINWSTCFYKAKKQTNIQALVLVKINKWGTVHQALWDLTYVFIRCKQDIVNQLPLLKFLSRNFMWLVIECLVWIRWRKNWVLTCSKWGLQNSWIISFLVHPDMVNVYQKKERKVKTEALRTMLWTTLQFITENFDKLHTWGKCHRSSCNRICHILLQLSH